MRRSLGLWPAIAVVVGTVIGSGIFLVPTEMIQAVGSPGMVFAVWIFGGILSLFGALTYAELSAALPGAGGEYVYLNAAYGPFFGFIVWMDADLGGQERLDCDARDGVLHVWRRVFSGLKCSRLHGGHPAHRAAAAALSRSATDRSWRWRSFSFWPA